MADEKEIEISALETAITNHRGLRPRTREIYLNSIRMFLEHAGASERSWTRDVVLAWRRELQRRLRAQTVNLHIRGLQSASMRWAEKTGQPDFAADISPLAAEPSDKHAKPLNYDQVQRLLATTNEDRPIDLRDRALLILGFRTGLRRAAMGSVTFERFVGNLLTIDTKGGNTLTLGVDGEVTRALKPWMLWLRKHGVTSGPIFRGLARPHVDGSVTVRPKAIGPDNVTAIVRERAKAAGIKTEIHRDVFRYTFLDWCKKNDIDPDRVREVTSLKVDDTELQVSRAIGHDLPALL